MTKTPEQEKFDEFYAPELDAETEDEEQSPCDYGMDSECVEPSLRNVGCCFECWLFQEMEDCTNKVTKKNDSEIL